MSTRALMWEARAAAGRSAELLAWARESALPALTGAARVELFTAQGERVLLISWWQDRPPAEVPDPPEGLLARPVHRWAFDSEYVAQAG